MKVLHIAERMKSCSGGRVCVARNLEMLQRYFGKDNVIDFKLYRRKTGKLGMLWTDVSNVSFYGIDRSIKRDIVECIERDYICLVFLDTSNIGNLAKVIKTRFSKVKIVTFFHNVERLFFREQFSLTHRWIFLHKMLLANINERNALKYSDVTVALNNRDAQEIANIYSRDVDVCIPISLDAKINETDKNHRGEYMLFLGSNFPPNVSGICFFIEKVLPHVSYKLFVAGSGMEALRSKYNDSEKLEIHGFVEDLEEVYSKAMFVVMPIFTGSGMKVKTAEALKYGKYIMAGPEALVGYEWTDAVAKCCPNAQAFITEINNYNVNRSAFNNASRELFERKYSNEAVSDLYAQLFDAVLN